MDSWTRGLVDEDDRDNLLVVDLFLVFHVSCLLVACFA